MAEEFSYKWTWAAIIVAVLLVVPGTIVGGLIAALYKWFLGQTLGQSSWFIALELLKKLMLLWFPSFLHGFVAGALAIWGVKFLFTSANFLIVSFAASAAWLTIGLLLGILGIAVVGVQEDLVSLIAQVLGIVLGLFALHLEGS